MLADQSLSEKLTWTHSQGDAPIQMIDVSETTRLDVYYSLARACEGPRLDLPGTQDLTRMPQAYMERRLYVTAMRVYGNEALASRLRPVVMFRLCTRMCRVSY